MNRIDRLMATILLLQGHRVIKAGDIADHFEISLRTVYRDIAALSEGGVPIVAEAGVGYSLLKGYSMPPVMFTAEEASALFLGGELVEHLTDPSLQAQMRSALLKIRAVLPRPQQDQLDRLKQTTALLIRPPTGRGQSAAVLTRLQNALAHRRVLAMQYRTGGEGEPKRRDVEPLGLIFYADHWHLIAYCRLRQDHRDFRTDRITELVLRSETFEARPDFSVRDYINAWREKFIGVQVTLKVAQPAAERFRRAWMGAVLEEKPVKDGLLFTLLADPCDWLVDWLLSFGDAVEVVLPETLRTQLVDKAEHLVRHHRGNGKQRPALPVPTRFPSRSPAPKLS